jgi:alpha/beta hydrolase fold
MVTSYLIVTLRCLQISRMALVVSVLLASLQLFAEAQGKERPVEHPTFYRTTQIDGLSIFYREAGPKDAATLLLLHGLPSSSRMFETLFARLSDRYHLVAPDYPGFGHSDRPAPKKFTYTFRRKGSKVECSSSYITSKRSVAYLLFSTAAPE